MATPEMNLGWLCPRYLLVPRPIHPRQTAVQAGGGQVVVGTQQGREEMGGGR